MRDPDARAAPAHLAEGSGFRVCCAQAQRSVTGPGPTPYIGDVQWAELPQINPLSLSSAWYFCMSFWRFVKVKAWAATSFVASSLPLPRGAGVPISLIGQCTLPPSSIYLAAGPFSAECWDRNVGRDPESAQIVDKSVCRKECIALFICIDLVLSPPSSYSTKQARN